MKTKFKNTALLLFMLIMSVATLISCSNDDESNNYKDYSNLIIGIWDFDIDTRFQENGHEDWVDAKGRIENHVIEFQKNGLAKIAFSVEFPYSVSGNKLNLKGLTYTITELDEDKLVFEGVEGKAGEEEFNGKTGTLYCIYKGLKTM